MTKGLSFDVGFVHGGADKDRHDRAIQIGNQFAFHIADCQNGMASVPRQFLIDARADLSSLWTDNARLRADVARLTKERDEAADKAADFVMRVLTPVAVIAFGVAILFAGVFL